MSAYLCADLHVVTDDSNRQFSFVVRTESAPPNLAQAARDHRAKAVRAVLRVVGPLKC
jgi:hypothetical protein